MINTILLSLLLGSLSYVNDGHIFQAKESKLFFKLSGPDIFEGHYKPVAYFTLYRFDDKCKLHQQDKIKLNKKTTQAEAPYVAGKSVKMSFYYADERTRYGRSAGDYVVFYPEENKDYTIDMTVENGKVAVLVAERGEDGAAGKVIKTLRGYANVKCE